MSRDLSRMQEQAYKHIQEAQRMTSQQVAGAFRDILDSIQNDVADIPLGELRAMLAQLESGHDEIVQDAVSVLRQNLRSTQLLAARILSAAIKQKDNG